MNRETLPVLITSFNRPDLLEQVLKRTKDSGCTNIYFASDGPRNDSDKVLIQRCFNLVLDFYPEIHSDRILRRTKNLGCRVAMAENIIWFFDSVEFGVVLEDDCLPSELFFDFMIDALSNFESSHDIFLVSGYAPICFDYEGMYRKSIYPLIWGWGSWASRIKRYRLNFDDYKSIVSKAEKLRLNNQFTFYESKIWTSLLRRAGNGRINTWDYSLTASAWREMQYVIHSKLNLVENIGFRADATHTIRSAPEWAEQKLIPDKAIFFYKHLIKYSESELKMDRQIEKAIYNLDFTGLIRLYLGLIKRLVISTIRKPIDWSTNSG